MKRRLMMGLFCLTIVLATIASAHIIINVDEQSYANTQDQTYYDSLNLDAVNYAYGAYWQVCGDLGWPDEATQGDIEQIREYYQQLNNDALIRYEAMFIETDSIISNLNDSDYINEISMIFDANGNLSVIRGEDSFNLTFESYLPRLEMSGAAYQIIDAAPKNFVIRFFQNVNYVNGMIIDSASGLQGFDLFSDNAIEYATIVALVIIAILVIGYKNLKDYYVFQVLLKIPLEIIMLLTLEIGLIWVYFIEYVMGNIVTVHLVNNVPDLVTFGSHFFIMLVFLVFYSLLSFWIFYLKYFIIEGIVTNIKRHSLLYRVGGRVNRAVYRMMTFDIRKPVYRQIAFSAFVSLIGEIIFLLLAWHYNRMIGLWLVLLVIFTVFYYVMFTKRVQGYVKERKQTYDFIIGLCENDFNFDLHSDSLNYELVSVLKRLQNSYERAINQEVAANNMRTELISNVSHDLKTPLTSIITYIDLIKRDSKKEYLDIIDTNANKLKRSIDDMFELARANTGNLDLSPSRVNLQELVSQIVFEFEDEFAQAGLKIKRLGFDQDIFMELDVNKTARIFDNICSNIIKYAMPDSRVFVNLVNRVEEVEISFKNISRYEQNTDGNRLLERFVQGDLARTNGGTGIGLAIVKSFVEIQNGKVDVDIDGDVFKITVIFPKTNPEPQNG